VRCRAQLLISFGGIGLLFMKDYAPSAFQRNWPLVVPYLCSRFCIFDRLILEEYVSQVERGPHLFQSCLCATQDGLPPATKEMHLFFESLVIIDAPGQHAS